MTRHTDPAPHVVCIGGGYVAIYLAKALRRAVRRGDIALTVISRDNFHTFHGFVGEMLSGRIQPQQILSPARRLFRPARFVNAEVTAVDPDARTVTFAQALDAQEQVIAYDHLVVSVGVADDLDGYPGLAQHALRLRDYRDAWRTKNHLLRMMEAGAIEADPEERRRLLTFVVAGGGYGGVEVITELDEWARALTERDFRDVDAEEVRMVLVCSGDRILPELQGRHDRLVRWAERFLDERTGVEVHTGVRVAAATGSDVRLTDGTVIPTRTVITSTGTASSPLLAQLGVPRDERGRIVVDDHVRVPGHESIWAGGDCAAVPHPAGGTCPQVAIFAMMHGWRIGRNILRVSAGRDPRRFRFTELGDACSLGRRRAVAHLRGIPLTGVVGWLTWKSFLLFFVPLWDRQLRILLDWLLTPLTGREINQLDEGRGLGMTHELFEPGQDIVAQGEIGRTLYLVLRGQVEVLVDGVRVAELGPGDHFGERAVFDEERRSATVRAVTRTEVVALNQASASTLSDSLPQLGGFHRVVALDPPADAPSAPEPDPA